MKYQKQPRFKIDEERTTTVRELDPGTWFIYHSDVRFLQKNGQRKKARIFKRTEDPFTSLTTYGSKVRTFPSERVHTAVILPEESEGGEGES